LKTKNISNKKNINIKNNENLSTTTTIKKNFNISIKFPDGSKINKIFNENEKIFNLLLIVADKVLLFNFCL
jgi:hypothetical protein